MHYKVDPHRRISRISRRFSLEALVFLYTRQDGHDARLALLRDAKAKEASFFFLGLGASKRWRNFHEISMIQLMVKECKNYLFHTYFLL